MASTGAQRPWPEGARWHSSGMVGTLPPQCLQEARRRPRMGEGRFPHPPLAVVPKNRVHATPTALAAVLEVALSPALQPEGKSVCPTWSLRMPARRSLPWPITLAKYPGGGHRGRQRRPLSSTMVCHAFWRGSDCPQAAASCGR